MFWFKKKEVEPHAWLTDKYYDTMTTEEIADFINIMIKFRDSQIMPYSFATSVIMKAIEANIKGIDLF